MKGNRNTYSRFFSVFVYTAVLFLVATSGFSQTTKVSGKVYDAATNEPLPFVNILFKNSKIGTITNMDGEFEIETYYATDSLMASFVGYVPQMQAVQKDKAQKLDFALEASSVDLQEFVVVATEEENPAHPIFRKIIEHKDANNREKLEAYQYEVYNKVEFDLNNITDKFTKKRIFKPFEFIFENIDSTNGKAYLPVFMTESLSDFYFKKNPKTERELIKATKVSGIENESVSQFLGDMYQSVNVYDNYVTVFGKNFVSPIANFGMGYYKYYLLDSAFIDNNWCYKIRFMPKRKQELTFVGDFWVNDTTYAIKKIEAGVAEDANINFVNALYVTQEFDQVENEVWMLTKDQLLVDFNLTDKTLGFFGRKTTSYKDFVINKPKDEEFYKGPNNVLVADDANAKTDDFWGQARHDTLSKSELAIYNMVDSMNNIPQFRTYVDIIQLIVTGYKVMGKVEVGPYSSMYSYNPVEGHRFRLGGRTSNAFSTRLMIEGYGAYGLTDERFKYGGGFKFFVSKKPRRIVGVSVKDDVEQLGQSQNAFRQDNVLSSFFRRNPAFKLTNVEEGRLFYETEWFQGFSNTVLFRRRVMRPLGDLVYDYLDDSGEIQTLQNIKTSEVNFYTRFAYKEKFISGEFERVSLGTRFPILELNYTLGMKDFLASDYDYQKLIFRINHKVRLGPLGHMVYNIEGGKVWGKLPYPLLVLHKGNETYYYYDWAFNTMNFFEFVSDEYISAGIEQHLDGLIFNRIPLFRKLKWREVLTAKGVMGRLSAKHQDELLLLDNMYSLEEEPFGEAAVGIENIFKVLRVDGLWRLSYLDHKDIVKFGIRAKLQIDF